jgi:hypothetical protein
MSPLVSVFENRAPETNRERPTDAGTGFQIDRCYFPFTSRAAAALAASILSKNFVAQANVAPRVDR